MARSSRLLLLLTTVGWLGLIVLAGLLYILWTDSNSRFQELRDRQLETHQSTHEAQAACP